MAEQINYGYEPNNEIDKFDSNVWQGNQPTCAIRSQEIILRDYGICHTQEELIEFATKNGWFNPSPENGGTDKYSVGNILDACGIPTTRKDNATINDIISELKAGHRVIVSVDADELWVKNESNLLKRVAGQITNKTNDTIQNFLGIEGANHALIVAGANINTKNPSDIKVTLIDPGTGEVCVEYEFKDFHDAWSDGHCRMISTNIPAPFQYNYHTHQIEPSNFNTDYSPSMAVMPDGLANQFQLPTDYYTKYEDLQPAYDDKENLIGNDVEDAELQISLYENHQDDTDLQEDDLILNKEEDTHAEIYQEDFALNPSYQLSNVDNDGNESDTDDSDINYNGTEDYLNDNENGE